MCSLCIFEFLCLLYLLNQSQNSQIRPNSVEFKMVDQVREISTYKYIHILGALYVFLRYDAKLTIQLLG